MQYQKEEIRERILAAALTEFEKNGYRGAAVGRIAESARVPVGNLYRYFAGKEQLFDAVVSDVTQNLPRVIREIYERDIAHKNEINAIAENVAGGIMHIYKEYGRKLLLLVDRAEGTKYESFLPQLLKQIADLFRSGIYGDDAQNHAVMADIIARGFVNGLFTVMRTAASSEELAASLKELLLFYFYNIEERTHS